ncbi:hypothetical protein F2P81_003372 [Scophthalmus maximus]|uniref:Uncharacterized protein n=1 Tax=Scophthalmus maximus TaxID=52904 RepID=A0A6A4TLX5_SCOMX|nr:hypothetical protein F2P81_003372 [Scophthalmus maximus]
MSSDFCSSDGLVERGSIPLDIDNVHMLLQAVSTGEAAASLVKAGLEPCHGSAVSSLDIEKLRSFEWMCDSVFLSW